MQSVVLKLQNYYPHNEIYLDSMKYIPYTESRLNQSTPPYSDDECEYFECSIAT